MSVSLFILILFHRFSINQSFKNIWNLQRRAELNLDQSYFTHLKNYHINAKAVTENDYPWIARVIHSQKNSVPFMCTAICVDDKIFITAARCVTVLKVAYTSLMYQNKRLLAKAFVMPTKESKQLYDDIGFIIVNDDYTGPWKKIETFSEKRPDNVFKWFEKMKFKDYSHKVIGYAMKKGSQTIPPWKNDYQLTELDVIVDIQLCRGILPYNKLIVGFNVPCYHSCPYDDQMKMIDDSNYYEERCENHHGTLGGALVNIKTKKLFGVATWASFSPNFNLPVGFAVPNSESYFEDYACSKKIRDSQETDPKEGFYQRLCDNKRKYDNVVMKNYEKDYYNNENIWDNFLY